MKRNFSKIKRVERIFRGVANHWRVSILLYIKDNPKADLNNISDNLKCNIKTASEHLRRLKHAGLINKKYLKNHVQHTLSPYGEKIIKTILVFLNS